MQTMYQSERFCYTYAGWIWHQLLVHPEQYEIHPQRWWGDDLPRSFR
jgi:hypothetical protein